LSVNRDCGVQGKNNRLGIPCMVKGGSVNDKGNEKKGRTQATQKKTGGTLFGGGEKKVERDIVKQGGCVWKIPNIFRPGELCAKKKGERIGPGGRKGQKQGGPRSGVRKSEKSSRHEVGKVMEPFFRNPWAGKRLPAKRKKEKSRKKWPIRKATKKKFPCGALKVGARKEKDQEIFRGGKYQLGRTGGGVQRNEGQKAPSQA